MARFLDTEGISHHISQLMKNSGEKLIIISPFLKISPRFKEVLEIRDKDGLKTIIIYGIKKLQEGEEKWIRSLNKVDCLFCENLHAKCYLNEKEAVIGSMNLYEHSQINNYEMGIWASKKEDPELFEEVTKEVTRLIKIINNQKVNGQKPQSSLKKGFCIRCKKEINFDMAKPYCKECYAVWGQYENEDYEEEYCHACGKKNSSTLLKPVCYGCYKKV